MTAEIKCTNCGTINIGNAAECRVCGHPLHFSEAAVLRCPKCNSTLSPTGEERCVSCGWSAGTKPRVPQRDEPAVKPADCEHLAEAELHTVRSFTVGLAAVFMMLAGGLGIFHALMASLPGTSGDLMSNYESVIPAGKFLDDVLQQYVFVSVLMFLFGVLSIALSMSAVRRTSYAVSLAGAVFGIMSIGFLFGAFFGLMALILLVISRREFLLECA